MKRCGARPNKLIHDRAIYWGATKYLVKNRLVKIPVGDVLEYLNKYRENPLTVEVATQSIQDFADYAESRGVGVIVVCDDIVHIGQLSEYPGYEESLLWGFS